MVAFTDSQFLPYQVDVDRPCDAPNVWCDFTNLVDTQLFTLQTLLKRVSPAIPAAKVTRSTALSVSAPIGVIPWEVVEFDTDSMVDLAASVTDITPHRIGSYLATCYMEVSGGTANDRIGSSLKKGFSGPDGQGGFSITNAREDDIKAPGSGIFYLRTSTIYQWSSSDVLGIGALLSFPSPNVLTVNKAQLAVYWLSDRIS